MARACAARAWIAAGSRPTTACATTPRACGNARRCPALGSAKPEVGGSTRFSQARRSARRGARAVARGRGLRHAVLGLRHHRAQLSRHRPGGRRRARPRRGRSQHRAGVHGRRARHLRGHARDSRQGGVRAPAAQPRHRQLRPQAHRQHAGAQRQVVRPQDRAGRSAVGGRHGCRTASSTRARRRSRR